MCYQTPDQLIVNNRKLAIAPLPVNESINIVHTPKLTISVSTAHSRGYIATWALIDEKLYLTEVEGCYQLKSTAPVFANWVDATIRPADGTYAKSINIQIKNGLITNF